MSLPVVRPTRDVGRWDPFREFEDLHAQMGRWMDTMLGRAADGVPTWSPLADVSETDDAYLIEVDLPGVKRDDITVDLTGRDLSITGERTVKERQGWFRHRTRRTGQFHYSVTLPNDVDADNIEATLSDGVLVIRVPKSHIAKPRRITVTER